MCKENPFRIGNISMILSIYLVAPLSDFVSTFRRHLKKSIYVSKTLSPQKDAGNQVVRLCLITNRQRQYYLKKTAVTYKRNSHHKIGSFRFFFYLLRVGLEFQTLINFIENKCRGRFNFRTIKKIRFYEPVNLKALQAKKNELYLTEAPFTR